MRKSLALFALAAVNVTALHAAESAFPRPPLFFKEVWKQTPKPDQHPATQQSVANPNLELKLYVPAGELLLTGDAGNENNPIHLWSGMCTSPCAHGAAREEQLRRSHAARAPALEHQDVRLPPGAADREARGWHLARRRSGRRAPRATGSSARCPFADLHWVKLDIARVVTTGPFVQNVDLSKVDEIGFADLMPGSGHGPGGWSDVAELEVYAKSVPRK